MEYNETGYRKWETKMNKMAKRMAKTFFQDFVEDSDDFRSYRSKLCKIDEIYLLTKVQTILMHSGVIMDHKIEESDMDGWEWDISVYLYTQEEYDSLPSSSDTPSESESEDEDPI
jgi:hypothetical protein